MTENEFRIKHSSLIEYYQYIEMRLKAICAGCLADEEKDWFSRYEDYQSDPWGILTLKLKDIQKRIRIDYLSDNDFIKLDNMRKERNYWTHQCFGGIKPIVFKKGELKNSQYAINLENALRDAVEWDEKLADLCQIVLDACRNV